MIRKIPNILTIGRIIIIPIILFFMYIPTVFASKIAGYLFLMACITDFLDGYLARVLSVQSKIGVFLDPIADKLLVGSVILVLVSKQRIDLIPAVAIILREILVSGLREFLAGLKVSVPVTSLAKVKTFFQMAALFILIMGNEGFGLSFATYIGRFALWFSAALTIFTGYIYMQASIKYLKEE
jgi:CDP-diacylglycerol--glycerol-3-phosphate 3-phosphatidyltransferase